MVDGLQKKKRKRDKQLQRNANLDPSNNILRGCSFTMFSSHSANAMTNHRTKRIPKHVFPLFSEVGIEESKQLFVRLLTAFLVAHAIGYVLFILCRVKEPILSPYP